MHKWIKLICLCIFFFKTVEKNRIYEYNEKEMRDKAGEQTGRMRVSGSRSNPDVCLK